jgi:hypothetical protein
VVGRVRQTFCRVNLDARRQARAGVASSLTKGLIARDILMRQ